MYNLMDTDGDNNGGGKATDDGHSTGDDGSMGGMGNMDDGGHTMGDGPELTVMALTGWILATPVQFGVGYRYYQGAYKTLAHGGANMDVLIALGTSTAYFCERGGGGGGEGSSSQTLTHSLSHSLIHSQTRWPLSLPV